MHPAKLHRPERDRPHGNVRQALRHVAARPELRVPLVLMLVLSTVGFNFQVVIPLLADRSFDGEVSAYSLLMIAMALGSITGALTVGTRKRVSRELITASALGFGITSLMAAAAPTLALEMLSLGLLGVCSVTFAAGINSGLQLAAAPEMRGRVMAIYSIVFLGSTVVGGPIAGLARRGGQPPGAPPGGRPGRPVRRRGRLLRLERAVHARPGRHGHRAAEGRDRGRQRPGYPVVAFAAAAAISPSSPRRSSSVSGHPNPSRKHERS